MGRPLVSIVVPVYNAEGTVSRCLESIPDRPDIQVVVVDDASSDGSLGLVSEFSASRKGQDVRVASLLRNSGEGIARNVGMSLCTGAFLHALDSDDYLYTGPYIDVVDSLSDRHDDIVYIDFVMNDGSSVCMSSSNKMTMCAFWIKLVRRDMVAGIRVVEDRICGVDAEYNSRIQVIPHRERFTGIKAYHYNFPREGSMCWKNARGLPI